MEMDRAGGGDGDGFCDEARRVAASQGTNQ
jgi:hypothetical protein